MNNLYDFFYIIAELKKVPRKGWKEKVGIKQPESVADHSFLTAFMAMIFSDKHDLKTERIIKMALLHDLAEVLTGDFIPGEVSRENKKTIENEAMDEILSKLPADLSKKYLELWNEYQDGKTREAILLHDLDRLEMAIQAMKYFSEGFPLDKLKEFITSARKEIRSKEAIAVLDNIL